MASLAAAAGVNTRKSIKQQAAAAAAARRWHLASLLHPSYFKTKRQAWRQAAAAAATSAAAARSPSLKRKASIKSASTSKEKRHQRHGGGALPGGRLWRRRRKGEGIGGEHGAENMENHFNGGGAIRRRQCGIHRQLATLAGSWQLEATQLASDGTGFCTATTLLSISCPLHTTATLWKGRLLETSSGAGVTA